MGGASWRSPWTDVSCTATDESDFTCSGASVPLIETSDSQLVHTATFDLGAISADHLEGTFAIEQSCTGPRCAEFAEDFPDGLPCTTEGAAMLNRSMPDNFVPEAGAYAAEVDAALSTCGEPPSVPARQNLRIEAGDDGKTAKVFTDADDTGLPFDCRFVASGGGRTLCAREVEIDGAAQSTEVDASWTSATSFEGGALLSLSADDTLPCLTFFHLTGKVAAAL
jgi:hypothetical protein